MVWTWKWRIDIPDQLAEQPPSTTLRIQFRLRHLLECTTLAACLLALYRLHIPNGLSADWWWELARSSVTLPLVLSFFVPTLIVPWIALAFPVRHRIPIAVLAGLASLWVAMDGALVWLGGFARFQELLPFQAGASAAGLMSAIALRILGYRLIKVE